MDESMGPCERTCPEKILKLLTPLDPADPSNRYAVEWRNDCWERIKKAKERKRFKPGDIIEFESSFAFTNGSEASVFKVVSLKPRLVMQAQMPSGFHFNVQFSWDRVKRVPYKLVADPSVPAPPAPVPAPIPLRERLAACKPAFQPALL